jgi:diguanylate cyclase (GGDEF)-like protein
MAATDPQNSNRAPRALNHCLSTDELAKRLEEEVGRAERQRTALGCVLVSIDEVERLARAHGDELPARALAYMGTALAPELRRFDRVGHAAAGELLVVLPGADERRAEIVARRALGRLHAIKVEVHGTREPLRISMGIAAWSNGLSGEQLLSRTRLAARRREPPARDDTELAEGSTRSRDELPLLGRP